MADARGMLVQLKRYKLCKLCFERHAGSNGYFNTVKSCHICRGLMEDLDSITEKVMATLKGYEFDTFLIGATLPTPIYEREDAMRARLKILGMESVKNQLTRELGIRLARLSKRKVDYLKPDITISLTIDRENSVDVAVKSRPLAIAGLYIKKSRGLPQKQNKCTHCEGKGCESCNYSGLFDYESVEGIIAKKLMAITKGQTPRFSWVGSEDQNSLVLGNGRPYYARVFNPQRRKLKKTKVKDRGVEATMSLRDDTPDPQARFVVKTRIHVRCAGAITKQDLTKLHSIGNTDVSFENKSKMVTRKIYSVRIRQIDSNQFTLTITADGGLMIKQFVGGEEYMNPNISEILGAKCECITFDILDVAVQ